MTVRTLKTSKDGKPANHAPGSPKWRAAGRDASKMERKEPTTPADVSDLENMEPEELARHLSREALLTVAKIMRKPDRNAQAQLSAAREIIARGVRPPVQKVDIDSRVTQMESEAETARRRREERLAKA